MINTERKNGKAAEKYAEFVGKHVIIYYRDMRDNDRKIHGIISSIDGDNIYMNNGEWSGMLNCRNARVTLVSTLRAGMRKRRKGESLPRYSDE